MAEGAPPEIWFGGGPSSLAHWTQFLLRVLPRASVGAGGGGEARMQGKAPEDGRNRGLTVQGHPELFLGQDL